MIGQNSLHADEGKSEITSTFNGWFGYHKCMWSANLKYFIFGILAYMYKNIPYNILHENVITTFFQLALLKFPTSIFNKKDLSAGNKICLPAICKFHNGIYETR